MFLTRPILEAFGRFAQGGDREGTLDSESSEINLPKIPEEILHFPNQV